MGQKRFGKALLLSVLMLLILSLVGCYSNVQKTDADASDVPAEPGAIDEDLSAEDDTSPADVQGEYVGGSCNYELVAERTITPSGAGAINAGILIGDGRPGVTYYDASGTWFVWVEPDLSSQSESILIENYENWTVIAQAVWTGSWLGFCYNSRFRAFEADGTPRTEERVVFSPDYGGVWCDDIAWLDERFLVALVHYMWGPDGNDRSEYIAQVLDANGEPVGDVHTELGMGGPMRISTAMPLADGFLLAHIMLDSNRSIALDRISRDGEIIETREYLAGQGSPMGLALREERIALLLSSSNLQLLDTNLELLGTIIRPTHDCICEGDDICGGGINEGSLASVPDGWVLGWTGKLNCYPHRYYMTHLNPEGAPQEPSLDMAYAMWDQSNIAPVADGDDLYVVYVTEEPEPAEPDPKVVLRKYTCAP